MNALTEQYPSVRRILDNWDQTSEDLKKIAESLARNHARLSALRQHKEAIRRQTAATDEEEE